MLRTPRLDDYHRRRHRAARQRRGLPFAPPPRGCNEASLIVFPGGRNIDRGAYAVAAALPFLARRLSSYQAVAGFLYRSDETGVDLHVVTSAPMTAALGLLARRWVAQVGELAPAQVWRVHVAPHPPPEDAGYLCVFWRRP